MNTFGDVNKFLSVRLLRISSCYIFIFISSCNTEHKLFLQTSRSQEDACNKIKYLLKLHINDPYRSWLFLNNFHSYMLETNSLRSVDFLLTVATVTKRRQSWEEKPAENKAAKGTYYKREHKVKI